MLRISVARKAVTIQRDPEHLLQIGPPRGLSQVGGLQSRLMYGRAPEWCLIFGSYAETQLIYEKCSLPALGRAPHIGNKQISVIVNIKFGTSNAPTGSIPQ